MCSESQEKRWAEGNWRQAAATRGFEVQGSAAAEQGAMPSSRIARQWEVAMVQPVSEPRGRYTMR